VLLADDEGHIRAMMKAIVRGIGYDVAAEAANGQEAVDRFLEIMPDMALLDINMPVKTGYEALAEIIARVPEACVIMLTSVADLSTVQECIDLGATGYIRKDTPVAELRSMIAETWQGHLSHQTVDFPQERIIRGDFHAGKV
jgi:two-component system chemotaxis response regulator CheY